MKENKEEKLDEVEKINQNEEIVELSEEEECEVTGGKKRGYDLFEVIVSKQSKGRVFIGDCSAISTVSIVQLIKVCNNIVQIDATRPILQLDIVSYKEFKISFKYPNEANTAYGYKNGDFYCDMEYTTNSGKDKIAKIHVKYIV